MRFVVLVTATLLACWSATTPAGETVQQQATGTGSGSAVIEIGPRDNGNTTVQGTGKVETPVETGNSSGNAGKPGVEMILGGQSKNGVAKRSKLPVTE